MKDIRTVLIWAIGIIAALAIIAVGAFRIAGGSGISDEYLKTHKEFKRLSEAKAVLSDTALFPQISDEETRDFFCVLTHEEGFPNEPSGWRELRYSYLDSSTRTYFSVVAWFDETLAEPIPANAMLSGFTYQGLYITEYASAVAEEYLSQVRFLSNGVTYDIRATSKANPNVLPAILQQIIGSNV